MVIAFVPNKLSHRKFAFRGWNSTQYKIYAKQYSKRKTCGIRGVYAWMSGAELIDIVTDLDKGLVIDYGKRKFAALFITAGTYII